MRTSVMLVTVVGATLASTFAVTVPTGQSNSIITAVSTQVSDRITITTLTGQVYSNCTVSRIEPDGVTVFYAKGVARIPFSDLAEEYRSKYGYDPDKAFTYGQSVNKARAATAVREQEIHRLKKAQKAQAQLDEPIKKNVPKANQLPTTTGPALNIRGKVLQVVENGLIIRGVSLVADDQAAAKRRAGAWGSYRGSYVGKDKRSYDSDQIVFVFTSPKSFVDGSDFNMMCFPCGTHSYENVTGSSSTIKAFKTNQ